jgi:hypothetical protein
MAARQPVYGFIHGTVTAANDGELSRVLDGAVGHLSRLAGSAGHLQFRLNPGLAENVARFVQLMHAASAARAGIDD